MGIKISDLPAAGSVLATNIVIIDDATPLTKKATVTQLLDSKIINSPTITGTVIFQGTRMRILSIPGEVQTTNDTVTTVVSFTMLDQTLCAFDVIVTAALQTAVTKGGRWKRSVVYRRAGGVATIVGAIETGTDQETDAGLDVTIDTDGANVVRVRVTGLPATTNLNWTAELRVQETVATP